MKRRTKWILAIAVGTPVLLIAVAVVVLVMMSSAPASDLGDIDVHELPAAWAEESSPPAPIESDIEAAPGEAPPVDVPAKPTIASLGLPLSGTLVMKGDDKPFGSESYHLAVANDLVELRSEGKFWFKALIATITISFDQLLILDAQLRPVSLATSFDAPLGFDRRIQADFAADLATVRSGDEVQQIVVDRDDAFVIGTFSSYAIIPLLYLLREATGPIDLETLVFGGPPNRDDSSNSGLPQATVDRIEDATLRHADREISVSQYRISGDMGEMMLYALGPEMLGVMAGEPGDSLFVYRADYFEDGFEIPSAATVLDP